MSLRQVVEQNDTRAGRLFDLTIQALIVLSLVSFSVETLPDLASTVRQVLYGIEVVTVVVFTVEYLVRIAVAQHRMRFVFSFFGLVDLAAILPFYLTTGVDLRAIRAVRFVRLFRALKLLRYSEAIHRFRRAWLIAKDELLVFLALSGILLYLAAVGIYYFEREAQPESFGSVFHSLWWAVATLTTVGYGDVYPVTVAGKIFTFVILMIGLGIVAVPAGVLASALSEVRRDERRSSEEE